MKTNSTRLSALRREANLTQAELARLAGITRIAVLRYEQGIYSQLSEKLADTLSEVHPDRPHPRTIHSLYAADRKARRQVARNLLGVLPILRVSTDPCRSPFYNFRVDVMVGSSYEGDLSGSPISGSPISGSPISDSRMSFCNLLGLHPATVVDYERGLTRTMPAGIKEALIEVGFSEEYVTDLGAIQEAWLKSLGTSDG